ncbi:MAG TPA: FHA domain-containing protein [Candidatus Dormibacteraeota bacterium]|nr:FHA domain-containing protein [Candidatus Dormibacteraeota bacterium]
MLVLEVLSGPLDGQRWEFEREITIGRDDAAAQACLSLDRYVSRAHARVTLDESALVLTDLESRNGTRIEGARISGAVRIEPGTPFIVGRTALRVVVQQ